MLGVDYDPREDSTPGLEQEGVLVLRYLDIHSCGCGCEDTPKSKGRQFCMGHDARLRGKLIRAHLAGVPVHRVYPKRTLEDTAAEVAAEYGWTDSILAAGERKSRAVTDILNRANRHKGTVRVFSLAASRSAAAVYSRDSGYAVEYVTSLGQKKRVTLTEDEMADTVGELSPGGDL